MNKNLKTLGLAVLVALGAVASVVAAPPPAANMRLDQKGNTIPFLVANHMRDSATSEMVVCSGRCVLAAIWQGTGPVTSSVQIRNSSVADGSGALVAIRRFEVSNSGYSQNSTPPYPILLDKGITVTLPAASNGEEVTVEYLDLD
jgi:hypothetical protein